MLEWLFIERLVLSAVLGGLIGAEREMHDKPAGFRTHVLVCMGAAMFALISISVSGSFTGAADVSRIAAGVVTGIGFLAAGSIFRDKDRVSGLTTAADIWVLAAIGLSTGFGYYLLAAAATIIALIVLIVGRLPDMFLKRKAIRRLWK
jgi:putative Mg2+ transporter-C (MgtC) family protein